MRALALSLKRSCIGGPNGQTPRVAVVVSAWDLLDFDRSNAGPLSYLQKEYPLFAGRLADVRELDVMVFGLSIIGGDLTMDSSFRTEFLASDVESAGYTVFDENGTVRKECDLTLPLLWAMGGHKTTA